MVISFQTLSIVESKLPGAVVNAGVTTPETLIENVLSLMLLKLSVALTPNVLAVDEVTKLGVPVINPSESIVRPGGSDPLSNEYVMLEAGSCAVADS